MSALAAYIREQMGIRGWDQVRLERESGVPDATLSRILRKNARPNHSNLIKLARVFGDDPIKLVRLAGYPTGDALSPSVDEQAVLEQLRDLPWLRDLIRDMLALQPQNRLAVIALVDALQKQETDTTPRR